MLATRGWSRLGQTPRGANAVQIAEQSILSTKVESDHLKASLAGADYVMLAGTKENEFIAKFDGFRVVLRRQEPDVLQMGWEGDRPTSFRRLRSATPSASEIGQYVGRFVNEDLNVQWNLVLMDGTRLITTDAGWRIPLAVAAQDRFEAGPWVLEFRRDGDSISGFRLHRERLWRLVFEKISERISRARMSAPVHWPVYWRRASQCALPYAWVGLGPGARRLPNR